MASNNNLSESEQMYLVTIREMCETCPETPIPVPEIAKHLGVQPVSASQMINKLADDGYVKYYPYKGARLTPRGIKISTKILRNRRLWEVFFVRVLKMELTEADRLACQIEHYTSADVANRLSAFLENPTTSPHGDPIPHSEDDGLSPLESMPLTSLKVGQKRHIVRIEADQATTKFLEDEGLLPGTPVRVLAIGQQGDYLLGIQDSRLNLSADLIKTIFVNKINPSKITQTNRKEDQIMSVPLTQLKVGEKGVITSLNFKGSLRQRLLAMGIISGETIMVKRIAPLGDPIDFIIKGYDLSLRKSEAKEIQVTLVQEA